MATSPPGSWPVQTDLDTKPVPLDIGHPSSESDWKRMETSDRKRTRELPPEIIEQILYLTDPETFASLILVNHAWRAASLTPHLYAYHLSRCPSFSITNNVITGPFTDSSLPRLKQQFVREVKRNLFEAYLRPRQTVVSLTSSTTSSSASFPGGEAFDFAFSPNGVWTLALSSSRIYVLDTLSSNISVRRELKVLRRPVSAAILDDGSILAVLSTDRKVNVYDLSNASVKHLRAVTLDNLPHTIALSPKGEVLAAAYDGGIELHSLAINALATDRRSVKCDYIDSLAFSKDGTMLLGTTQHSVNPSTVVLSAPFHDETIQELPAKDVVSHMWTSQILFPNSSRDCSHATLLPDHTEGDANWTCTYDRVFESFRAVRTDDLRNGTTYFTGPKQRPGTIPRGAKTKLTPCTLPATTGHGDLVAAGFLGKDVWLYGVPEGLETSNVEHTPESTTSTRQNSTSSTGRSPAVSHTRGEGSELRRLPQWQVLVDKNRNVLVKGRMVAEVPGVTGVKWVEQEHLEKGSRSVAERLLVSAPGGVSEPSDIDEEGFASVDGGRLIVLDFNRGLSDGKIEQLHFEVGTVEPEMLEEQDMDIDAEVDIIRRRTTRQRIGHGIGTSVADALASAPEIPTEAAMAAALSNAETPAAPIDDPLIPRVTGRGPIPASPIEGLSLEEASQVFDGPYSHSQPRSRTSLYRSATAVAANRQRNPPRIPIPDSGQIRYRRPDGRGELPHESDADNWEPPPPMYTPKPEWPLPDYLRQTLATPMPKQNAFERRRSRSAERPRRASTVYESSSSASPQRRIISSPDRPTYLPYRRDTISTLDISDRRSNQLEPVSPTSAMGLSFPTAESEISSTSPHSSPSSTHRRPVSAFVGRFRPGHRKSLTARLTSPISPMPLEGVEERRLSGSVRSVSMPSSPIRSSFQTNRPSNRLTLSGANLQSRLEYPLPPAPEEESDAPTPTRPQTSHFGGSSRQTQNQPPLIPREELTTIPNLPSAEQLANLHNRYCHAPPPTTSQTMSIPPSVRTSIDDRQPPTNRPPRAALGATGGVPISPLTERRRLSIAQRNSFAASSPALLRPAPQRLDTIQSISSIISQQPSRSNSREIMRGGRRVRRRSRSAGPNVQKKSGGEEKRKWFGMKKGRKGKVVGEQGFAAAPGVGGGGGSAYLENSRMLNEQWGAPRPVEKEKDGKCVVM